MSKPKGTKGGGGVLPRLKKHSPLHKTVRDYAPYSFFKHKKIP